MDYRLTPEAERDIETSFKNNTEAHELLDLIAAEFASDPASTQCFDRRIVDRVRLCVATRKHLEKKLPRIKI